MLRRRKRAGQTERRLGILRIRGCRCQQCSKTSNPATIDEIMEWFDVTREQIVAVLEFAARSLDPPSPPAHESRSLTLLDARSV
jgi:hypothetical protein